MDGFARWSFGVLGVLTAAGIIGSVAMYGELQVAMATLSSQEQHIDALDRRVQSCENIIRRREETYTKQ